MLAIASGLMLRDLIDSCTPRDRLVNRARVEAVVNPLGTSEVSGEVARATIAHALNVALYADLLERVPSGAGYVDQQVATGNPIILDHGAVRTVAWPTASEVPAGSEQVARVLEPLGYSRRETYPLTKLSMTGYSYAHDDDAEGLAQWFVSEFHPDGFSDSFQHAVERTISTGREPIGPAATQLLDRLSTERSLPLADAMALLPVLFKCFTRLHLEPLDSDHELLRAESAEMAWIATEGTAFNHATDRVVDVAATAEGERGAGRPIKDAVEVSGSGRVLQTAHVATPVDRSFRTAEGTRTTNTVPGSFFEFIERRQLPDSAELDLAFDASNAQGIFKMTAPALTPEPKGHH